MSSTLYDYQGNEIAVASEAIAYEPADDDIPHLYWTGTLPTTKSEGEVQGKFHYVSKTDDFEYYATVKVQGDSSASNNYPKRNFTLKMYTDNTYAKKVKYAFKNWGELNKFVLKAHWIDHSHIRNVGTAKIWGKICRSRSDFESLPEELRTAPNNGATDGFTCKMWANGVYQGLYELIVPKDKLFGQDSDNANHSILNSDSNTSTSCSFGTTSPTLTNTWTEELQDSMSSAISTSFSNFIKFVAGSTDAGFVANAESYFDVQSVIDFDIFARIFCIIDNIGKNQIFFTYDGIKWYEGAWDLDAVLGLRAVITTITADWYSSDTAFQEGYVLYTQGGLTNTLYTRIESLFTERFIARYNELRAGILSNGSILDVYEKLYDTIKNYEDLIEEDYATTTADGAYVNIPQQATNNIQQIRAFVKERLVYMDAQINALS